MSTTTRHFSTFTSTRALSHSSSPYAFSYKQTQSTSNIMTKVFVYRIYNRCRSKERTIKYRKTCQCATGQNLQLQWILHTGNTRSASKNLVRPNPWAQCQDTTHCSQRLQPDVLGFVAKAVAEGCWGILNNGQMMNRFFMSLQMI